eukprot:CCRYP_020726-RC/>CCRYP_020726-RC protein AED:0.09 eAED:0.09 QI:773/1/1/1/0.8/0.66/6/232/998
MAPYEIMNSSAATFRPESYQEPGVLNFIHNLPRYGFGNNVVDFFEGGEEKSSYVKGVVISSCVLLLFFLLWCLVLLLFKLYLPSSFLSGYIEPPDDSAFHDQPRGKIRQEDDEETSSTHSSGERSDDMDDMSIDSTIFWKDPLQCYGEELTMAVIAREQKNDEELTMNKQRYPEEFSTTTNGRITLVTTPDRDSSQDGEDAALFRVYIPRSLRLRLLRTYHDCIVHPDDVSNPQTMIYEFFTWNGIRRDVRRYLQRYRASMERGNNSALALVEHDDDDADSVDSSDPITLDVIAYEQAADYDLQRMMAKAPTVFSTATNGSIQLVTARGKDKKYRIVIPRKLQPKVLKTYHDCLVNPTPENNFEKVLYVHFTWNGIHGDVAEYVRQGGLTEEMMERDPEAFARKEERRRRRERRTDEVGSRKKKRRSLSPKERLRKADESRIENGDDESDIEASEASTKPIGLDEIAREQKKDKELRQLKKEEPFVFSTVRYGNTLLTTAQNFRDNKYRIVIPRSLQGRMLLTYKECLLNPTPERNFDTLLYNHFTWNGIHDDVDYFVKSHGRVPKKDDENKPGEHTSPLRMKRKNPKDSKTNNGQAAAKKERNHADDAAYEEFEEEYDRFERKVRRIRIVFLLSGFLMIISSILFLEQGVKRVFNSLNDSRDGLQLTKNVLNQGLIVSREYLDTQADIQEKAKQIGIYNTSQWCSADVANEFAIEIRDKTYEVGIQLRDTALKVESEVKGIQSDINGMLAKVDTVDDTLNEINMYMTIAKVIVVFIDVIVLCLMLACALAWIEKLHLVPILMGNSFFVPSLVVLLILFWCFTTLSLIGAMAGSDYCSMPDENTVNILVINQSKFSPLMFLLLTYYITGCLPERMPLKLEELATAIKTIGESVQNITGEVSNAIEQSNLAEQCGGDGPSKLIGLLGLADTTVQGVFKTLWGVKEVMECQNFNPIYTIFVYDALCNSGVAGLSWVFFTSLSMAVFSMLMITFRVAVIQF